MWSPYHAISLYTEQCQQRKQNYGNYHAYLTNAVKHVPRNLARTYQAPSTSNETKAKPFLNNAIVWFTIDGGVDKLIA